MLEKLLLLLLIGSIGWIKLQAQPPGAPKHKNAGPAPVLDSAYFMNKSNNLKTAGWITFGTGVALLIVGDLVYQNNNHPNDVFNGLNQIPGTFLMIFGGTSVIVSIGLFIGASNQKGKANSISLLLEKEDCPGLVKMGVAQHAVPAIGLSIHL